MFLEATSSPPIVTKENPALISELSFLWIYEVETTCAWQSTRGGNDDFLCIAEKTMANSNSNFSVDRSMWFLSGRLSSNESVRYLPIDSSPFLVGRRSNLNLCVGCGTVSSVHAEITATESTLILKDLGSTNGTFVNGQRITGTIELKPDDLVQFAEVPFRVQMQSVEAQAGTVCEDVYSQAMALVQFDRLMNENAVVPHFQPIVDMADESIVGYEVLGRSHIPGLETPKEMFQAAEKLNVEVQLSRMLRLAGIRESLSLGPDSHFYVNTHPLELETPGLIESMKVMRELSSDQKITLEIHEAAVTDPDELNELRAMLKDLDIGLAFDDFGAGQTRLAELSQVHPDVLKFDMSLIRSIHLVSDEHRRMIGTLVEMVRNLGVVALAEGIEEEAEAQVCIELGFELAQGYLYGRPAPFLLEPGVQQYSGSLV